VPLAGLQQVARILEAAPEASVARLLQSVHPYTHALSAQSQGVVSDVLQRFGIADGERSGYTLKEAVFNEVCSLLCGRAGV